MGVLGLILSVGEGSRSRIEASKPLANLSIGPTFVDVEFSSKSNPRGLILASHGDSHGSRKGGSTLKTT